MSTEIVEIKNPSRRRLYRDRYFTAISKLRLGILTEPEQGELELEGSYQEPELVQVQVPIFTRSSLIYLFTGNFALLRARPGPPTSL